MKGYLLLCFFFITLHVAPLLKLAGYLPMGRTAAVIIASTMIPAFLSLRYFTQHDRPRSRLDTAVLVYIVACLASVVCYFRSDAPTELFGFIYGLHYVVLPITCYFAIKSIEPEYRIRALRFALVLNFVAAAVGIYLYYARPAWYSAGLEEFVFGSLGSEASEDWRKFSRMQSYLGSTAVGTICASSILAATFLPRANLYLLIGAPVFTAAAVLSKQRGGIVATAFALGVLCFLDKKKALARFAVLAVAGYALVVILTHFEDTYTGTMDAIFERTSSVGEAFEHRGYAPGLAYLSQFPMGAGLGATLSASDAAGLASQGQVVDANFMRIAADLGVEGLFIFAAVLVCGYLSALKTQNKIGAIGLISVFIIISLGTNTLDSHLVSHCFWLFLGFIDTQNAPARAVIREEAEEAIEEPDPETSREHVDGEFYGESRSPASE